MTNEEMASEENQLKSCIGQTHIQPIPGSSADRRLLNRASVAAITAGRKEDFSFLRKLLREYEYLATLSVIENGSEKKVVQILFQIKNMPNDIKDILINQIMKYPKDYNPYTLEIYDENNFNSYKNTRELSSPSALEISKRVLIRTSNSKLYIFDSINQKHISVDAHPYYYKQLPKKFINDYEFITKDVLRSPENRSNGRKVFIHRYNILHSLLLKKNKEPWKKVALCLNRLLPDNNICDIILHNSFELVPIQYWLDQVPKY